jgi:hypothetical protein
MWDCLHNSVKQIYYSRCKVKYIKAFFVSSNRLPFTSMTGSYILVHRLVLD